MARFTTILGATAAATVLLLGGLARAQSRTQSPGDEPGSELQVYLVTFGPGEAPWEKYGHNALRIVNDSRSDAYHDVLWHWGRFDFEHPVQFVCRFIQARLMYEMAFNVEAEQELKAYGTTDRRSVQQQQLNLTSRQKWDLLRQLIRDYDDKETRVYRYDYYTNNCASRIRDVVDGLADHRLLAHTKGVASGTTYRFHTDRHAAGSIWLYVVLEAVLGHPVDQPIDQWAEMFLPEKLHDRINEIKIVRDGREMPLVLSDVRLYPGGRAAVLNKPPLYAPWLLLFGVLLGAIYAGLARQVGRHWAIRWGFILATFPWLLLMSGGGAFMWWAWLGTDHAVARNNENVMHVSVLSLALLVLVPRLALGRLRRVVLVGRIAFTIVGISVAGLLLKGLPWFDQVNYSIVALCLPVNAAMAYAVWVMSRKPVTAGVEVAKEDEPALAEKKKRAPAR